MKAPSINRSAPAITVEADDEMSFLAGGYIEPRRQE